MNTDWHKPLPKRLPQPSFAPALMAVGLMCLLWGAVTTWIVSVVGLVLGGVAARQWVKQLAGVTTLRLPNLAGESPAPRAIRRKVAKSPKAGALVISPRIGWYAAGLALATLFLVATGAEVTSHQLGLDQIHRWAGAVVGLLTLGLAIRLRRLGWMLFALAAVLAVTRGVAHAFLAQLFFAATVVIALVTSSAWKREPEMVDDMSTPPLRSCALVMVALVVLQVALGAAVRHKAMGPTLHIVGALVVALAILLVGVLVMNQCPTHRTLRPCAIIMMTIAGTQVFLGFAAFIVRMMADESTLPVVISTVAHVTTGALTLAATVVMTLQIRLHFRPAAAQASAVVP
jgi:heme A synthase